MTKYKVGDIVILTDSGYTHTTYRMWPDIPYGFKLEENSSMVSDTPYTVMSVGVHEQCNDYIVSVATDDMIKERKVFIIGTKGVRPIKDMKTYKAYEELNR